MRQDNSQNPKGTNRVAPPSSAQLQQLAGQLAGVHPSDLDTLLKTLCEFGWQFYPEQKNTIPEEGSLTGLVEVLEKAHVLWIVHPDLTTEGDGGASFLDFLDDVGRLLELARTYFASIEGSIVCEQLERIAANLNLQSASAAVIADPAPVRRTVRWFQDKAIIAAAVCLALLVTDLCSDHFPIWQLLAAIALISGVCPLMYRIGAKHGSLQTPVKAKP
jgi:hypothetical protein